MKNELKIEKSKIYIFRAINCIIPAGAIVKSDKIKIRKNLGDCLIKYGNQKFSFNPNLIEHYLIDVEKLNARLNSELGTKNLDFYGDWNAIIKMYLYINNYKDKYDNPLNMQISGLFVYIDSQCSADRIFYSGSDIYYKNEPLEIKMIRAFDAFINFKNNQ